MHFEPNNPEPGDSGSDPDSDPGLENPGRKPPAQSAAASSQGGPPAPEPASRWRMALLVASSALLSGIAVALWNRRALERMRETREPVAPTREPGEFI